MRTTSKEGLKEVFDSLKGKEEAKVEVLVNGYKVTIRRHRTNSEKVQEYYCKNPEKYKEQLERKREIYKARKDQSMCVKCGKRKLARGVYCKVCFKKFGWK